ncbi:hypothetical protein ACDA63_19690 [Uliginosibacterium sp. sgz301328]|uniref:hypothetical protein n=1 Tax=Uliginosibacterium sp. sgz301328 TaxID=3243764 RepID=UPI00359DDDF1
MRVTFVTAMFVLATGSAPLLAAESGGRLDNDLRRGAFASTTGSFAEASAAHSVQVSLARLGNPADVSVATLGRDARSPGASRYADDGRLVAASYDSFEAPSRVPGGHGLYASVLAGLGMILFTVMRRLNN